MGSPLHNRKLHRLIGGIVYGCDKLEKKYIAPSVLGFPAHIHFAVRKISVGLRPFVRKISAWSFGIYAWVVFSLTVLFGGALIIFLHRPQLGRKIAHVALRFLFHLLRIPLTVTGVERLPNAQHILLVNHTGFLDALVLLALLPSHPGYAFVAKQQYKSQGLLWPLLDSLGTLVLKGGRKGNVGGNMEAMTSSLRRGERLIIFPEGGIAPYPGIKRFHSGAFIAAANAHVPIAVAGLRGTRESLPLHHWLARRTAITLTIGPVLTFADTQNMALQERIKTAHVAMSFLCKENEIV